MILCLKFTICYNAYFSPVGKRSGKGSALIKDASASSTNANGFYAGEWTDNMRYFDMAV